MRINWKNPEDLTADIYYLVIWQHLIKYTGTISISRQIRNVQELKLNTQRINLTHEDILRCIDLDECESFIRETKTSSSLVLTAAGFAALPDPHLSSGKSTEIEMLAGEVVSLKINGEPIETSVKDVHKKWHTAEDFIKANYPKYSDQKIKEAAKQEWSRWDDREKHKTRNEIYFWIFMQCQRVRKACKALIGAFLK